VGSTFLKASPKKPALHEAVNAAEIPPLRAPSEESFKVENPSFCSDSLLTLPSSRKIFMVVHRWGADFNTAVRMAALRAASPD